MNRISRFRAGFTIVELMIVIAIAAVLIVLAAPSFSDMLDRRRVVGATEAVYSQLQLAKSEAIKSHRDVYVAYKSGTDWCSGLSNAIACDCTKTDATATDACVVLAGGTKVLKVISAGDYPGTSLGVSMTDVNIGFDSVRGTVTSDTASTFPTGSSLGTVTLTSQRTSRSLAVETNQLGRIVLCSPASTGIGGYRQCTP